MILKIYNLAGQELEILVNSFQTAGEHQITWQPNGLPSGIYFYKLTVRNQNVSKSSVKKMIVLK